MMQQRCNAAVCITENGDIMKNTLTLKTGKIASWHGIRGHCDQTIENRYECFCGKGEIITEEKTITAHNTFYSDIRCENCASKYRIVNANSRSWNIERIN